MTDGQPMAPALTARERAIFEQELVELEEHRMPAARGHGEHLLSRSETTEDEPDDVLEEVSFAENHVIQLRDLLARAPSVAAPTPGVARLHSRVRVRLDDGREEWYRIVLSLESMWKWAMPSDVINVFWGSPIAEALVGRRPGDPSLIRTPRGDTRITVIDLHHDEPPHAAFFRQALVERGALGEQCYEFAVSAFAGQPECWRQSLARSDQ